MTARSVTLPHMSTSYTPDLISDLKRMCAGKTRPEQVKVLQTELGLSDRQARRAYAKYLEPIAVVSDEGWKHLRDAKARYDESTVAKTAPESPKRQIKRLFWDIETSPNVVLSWRIGYKINLDHSNILKERAIICIGYKWEGESKARILTWDSEQDDKAMLVEFLKVAAEADEMVAHNGDQFDMPWFKTRCAFHGLEPMPDYKTVDTLQWARRRFYFNSNKLDYVAQYLGLGGKIKTEFGLWKDIVLRKDAGALKRMCDYCMKDVVLLEQVWARLSQLVPHKTHVGVLAGGERWTCPRDGSTNVYISKTKVTAAGAKQYQFRCRDCGGYYTIGAAAHAAYLEAKGKA